MVKYKMKIKFYFQDQAISSLPRKIIIEYTNKLMTDVMADKKIYKQVQEAGELAVYISRLETTFDQCQTIEPCQFRAYFQCVPSIFRPSQPSKGPGFCEMFPLMYFAGQINVDKQIELVSSYASEDLGLRKLGDFQHFGEPYVVEVQKSCSPEVHTINYLLSNEDSELGRLPEELAALMVNYIPGLTSVHTPIMTAFAQIIDLEIQRLQDKGGTFYKNKAKTLNDAKQRALHAALTSEELFSLSALYNYKEGNEKSVFEIARERKNPNWDSTRQAVKKCISTLSFWNSTDNSYTACMREENEYNSLSKKEKLKRIDSSFKKQGCTETEKNILLAEAKFKLKLTGVESWQSDLLKESSELARTQLTYRM